MTLKKKTIIHLRVAHTKIAPGSAWGDDPVYSVADAAIAIGVSRKTMYDHIAARKIDHICLGGKKFIRRSHIAAFITRGEVKAV